MLSLGQRSIENHINIILYCLLFYNSHVLGWCSWLSHIVNTDEVVGSSPALSTHFCRPRIVSGIVLFGYGLRSTVLFSSSASLRSASSPRSYHLLFSSAPRPRHAHQGTRRRCGGGVALGHRRGRLRHLSLLLRGLLPWSQVPRRRLPSGLRNMRAHLPLPVRHEVAGVATEHQAGVSSVSTGEANHPNNESSIAIKSHPQLCSPGNSKENPETSRMRSDEVPLPQLLGHTLCTMWGSRIENPIS